MHTRTQFESLNDLFRSLDLSEARAEVHRESRARVALVGPVNAGKSSLYNALQGWQVSPVRDDDEDPYDPATESLGLFTLVDLPTNGVTEPRPRWTDGYDLEYDYAPYGESPVTHDRWRVYDDVLCSLRDADLVVFVVDGAAGLRAVDYRWFTRIRAAGCTLLVALNKSDLLGDPEQVVHDLRARLAAPVVAVSARDSTNVYDVLLPQMLDMRPSLTVPLAREVASYRQEAAARLIRRSAMMCGLLSAEPVPLLDVPFQLMTQTRLVMRLAAMYGRTPTKGPTDVEAATSLGIRSNPLTSNANREVLVTLFGSLGFRHLAQQLIKLVPVLGWALSGVLGACSTWLIGWAAVTYFERAQGGFSLGVAPGGALGWLRLRGGRLRGQGAEEQPAKSLSPHGLDRQLVLGWAKDRGSARCRSFGRRSSSFVRRLLSFLGRQPWPSLRGRLDGGDT